MEKLEKIFVADMDEHQELTTFMLLKNATLRTDKNGKKYIDLVLGDRTGDIVGKLWNVAEPQIEDVTGISVGSVVKVRGNVNVFNGANQLSISRFRRASAGEYDVDDLVKKAPEDSEEMWQYLYDRACAITDEDYRKVAEHVLRVNKERLLYYPGASRNHHAEYGGLLYHMKRMLMNGEGMCRVYTNVNSDLVACGVIIHDIEKLNEINSNELGISDGYTVSGDLLGHIAMGVREMGRLALELNIPDEKAMLLEHMILSHHYEPEFGSPIRPKFPEAEMLHYLDMIDAKMYDFEASLAVVDEGSFTDRIWTLDRKLYKPTV